ncbi:hypothetical protein QOG_0480 [Clostridioides difficile Y10]|nr:hypothetical protein QOG_0480 [Clostridioides difficile Y10]
MNPSFKIKIEQEAIITAPIAFTKKSLREDLLKYIITNLVRIPTVNAAINSSTFPPNNIEKVAAAIPAKNIVIKSE